MDNGRVGGWVPGCKYGWECGKVLGAWMVGSVLDGWMDGRTDEYMDG